MPAMPAKGDVMAGSQWVRIDVGYLRNPKVRRVGRDATLMHLASVLYLGGHRIDDGLLPPEALPFVTGEAFLRKPDDAIAALVEHGLWVPTPDGAGFVVHDYDETNGAASEAAAARDRKRRWRDRHAGGDT